MSLKFIDFFSYRNYGFLFSLFVTIATIIGYFVCGLNLGIDFQGGTMMELTSKHPMKIKNLLSTKFHNTFIQQSDERLVLKFSDRVINDVSIIDQIKSDILQIDQEANILKIDFVGPKVSKDLINKAFFAFFWALFIIMLYLLLRFNWRFSISAIISLIHDLIASLGFFVLTRYEFNLTSIAAILTIIGYSVNDSVVIYDRVRENLSICSKYYLDSEIINLSINGTLSRTIMTFLTTFVTCIALWFFGGESLQSFSAVITFGVAFGTYSSIFIAANILPLMTKK